MNNINVKDTKLTKSKNNVIKGYFKLTDGTKTQFEVDSNGEWNQWGNNPNNMCVTTQKVMNFANSLINQE